MPMLHYASVYGKRGWKINAVDPGGDVMAAIIDSDAAGTVEDAAKEPCRLATLGLMAKMGCILQSNRSNRGRTWWG